MHCGRQRLCVRPQKFVCDRQKSRQNNGETAISQKTCILISFIYYHYIFDLVRKLISRDSFGESRLVPDFYYFYFFLQKKTRE